MNTTRSNDRGLFEALLGDGRPVLVLTGLLLSLSGLFAIFQSATGHFLPHDVAFLGMTAAELCAYNECRIVHFMIHDRVSFGGALIAVGTLYLWLATFPLAQKQPWAWWLFLVSSVVGFGSFLAYFGYGYLDTWHGAATLALLPCFGWGLWKSSFLFEHPGTPRALLQTGVPVPWASRAGLGRLCLLATAGGLFAGGLTIMVVGMTTVFVPQDLAYMQLTVDQLHAINPRLVSLIAHDRAGFGGGVCCCGLTMFFCVWCGQPSRSLWEALAVTGTVGFGTAIGVHPAIGYTDFVHLAPAYLGASLFTVGMILSFEPMVWRGHDTQPRAEMKSQQVVRKM